MILFEDRFYDSLPKLQVVILVLFVFSIIESYPIQDFPDTILSSFPEPLDTPPRFCYTPCKNPGGVAAAKLKGKTWEKRIR
jgi:hypothetical protein